MSEVTFREVVEKFKFQLISGEEGLDRPVLTSDLSRPGLVVSGYYTYYPAQRIQILGKTELSFLEGLTEAERRERFENLCHYDTPGIIITRGLEVPVELVEISEKKGVPVVLGNGKTTRLASRITNYLETRLAPKTAVHGVLVDIYGIGVLITGQSGVGKSETALELIKRGHRLVADDCVEISQEDEDTLIGTSPGLIEHLLEIRGLGIINVMTLFGAGAVRSTKQILLNINLELWDQTKVYDRLGLDEDKLKILDTEITKLTVPVRPGRNLAIIIEVAAMNFRLKRLGLNAAQQFADKLSDVVSEGSR